MDGMRALLLGSLWLCACGASAAPIPRVATSTAPVSRELSPDERLVRGLARLAQSRYAEAEADLRAAASGQKKLEAALALSEVLDLTGRYDEAIAEARRAASLGAEPPRALALEARALWHQGETVAAAEKLRGFASSSDRST